jgi:hypothetical protein
MSNVYVEPVAAPVNSSISPSGGTGVTQTFTFTATSPNAPPQGTDIGTVWVLFNTTAAGINGANACYFSLAPASNYVALVNDAGTAWAYSGHTGSGNGSIANSQCSINLGASSWSYNAGTRALTMNFAITFQPRVYGTTQSVWMVTFQQSSGANTGWWQPAGWTWTPTAQYYLTTTATAGGTISPASGWHNYGSVVQISATPNGGYQFSGFTGSLNSGSNPLAVTMNGAMTETANFTPSVTQYQLTTSVNLPGGGTVSPACPGGCMYNSGSPVTITATPASGYQFSGFTGGVGSGSNPLTVTINSAMTETANFTPLKPGINYFPRGHAWYSMLYEWYTQDCVTSTFKPSCSQGSTVADVVSKDLQMLSQNGITYIHLYLWDQDSVQGGSDLVPSGFQGAGFTGLDDGLPQNSPASTQGGAPNDSTHSQWTALAEFVQAAKRNGIWLFLEFAAYRPSKEIAKSGNAAAVGTKYANWVNAFFDHVASYQDALIWGITYGTGQGISGPFWQAAYPAISTHLQQNPYTNPAGRARLAVDANFPGPSGPMLAGLGGDYRWNWQAAQQEAYQWQTYQIPPDLNAFQLWNANAGDLQAALECVAGQSNSAVCPAPTCGTQCASIPFSQMVATEFGTGSSLESSPIGNGIAWFGDAFTPTTTATGQRDWLKQTLCVVHRLNILNTGIWGLYDSASWWEQNYNYSGGLLAWDGYWGLRSEAGSFTTYGADGAKPAWDAVNSFDPNTCPASNAPAAPVLALQADATYYTVNDSATLTYTAANVTSLSLSEPLVPGPSGNVSYACNNASALANPSHPNALLGSCAFTNVLAANTGTITLSGTNTDVDGATATGSSSTATTTSVTVGAAPIVRGLVNYSTGQSCDLTTNPGCIISANQTDTIEVFGLGFNPSGGNMVELANQSTHAWLTQADGYYFWDASRTQLNAQIGCFVTPGAWNLLVVSPNAGSAPSAGVSITVNHSGGCN